MTKLETLKVDLTVSKFIQQASDTWTFTRPIIVRRLSCTKPKASKVPSSRDSHGT